MVKSAPLLIVVGALFFFSHARAQNLPLYRIAYATSSEEIIDDSIIRKVRDSGY